MNWSGTNNNTFRIATKTDNSAVANTDYVAYDSVINGNDTITLTLGITLADNDGFVQVVSVFAIGFNIHFFAGAGGDNSITNSNSNFGQISLVSDGFKKAAFNKDNKGYITSVITPKAVTTKEEDIDWVILVIQKKICPSIHG